MEFTLDPEGEGILESRPTGEGEGHSTTCLRMLAPRSH